MRRTIALLSMLLVSASCTTTGKEATPAQQALLSAVQIDEPLADMPQADLARLETAAAGVLARGREMIPPLLEEIFASDEPERRLVLIKILHLTVEDVPSAEREAYDRKIEKTARRLLSGSESEDRYAGLLLTALPQESRLIPAAVGMLEDPDEDNRAFAVSVLGQVAGRDFGYRADGTLTERRAAVERWRRWWRENRDRQLYYQPPANPILLGFRAETNRITSTAGPYAVEVRDEEGLPVSGAVVAYSYSFTTPDGIGKIIKGREMTDNKGRALTSGERVVSGFRYLGAQFIVSRIGYEKARLQVLPHFLTPNSFDINVTLGKE